MTFIWWIYHFWARFWPYFNFVDFRAYFGPFSLVNRDRQKMADLLRKMASNQKMQENKPTLKFNFTIEKRWPVSIFELFGPQHLSHWALISNWKNLLICFHLFPCQALATRGVHVTYGGMSRKPVTAATSHMIFKVSSRNDTQWIYSLRPCLLDDQKLFRILSCVVSGWASGMRDRARVKQGL